MDEENEIKQELEEVKPEKEIRISPRTGKPVRQYIKKADADKYHNKASKAGQASGMVRRQQNLEAIYVDPQNNAQGIMTALHIITGEKVDTSDAEAVWQRFEEYFRLCARMGERPNVPGLAMSIGATQRDLWAWRTGRKRKPPEVVAAIKKAYIVLEHLLERDMGQGTIDRVTGIFLAKADFNYSDQAKEELDELDTDEDRTLDEIAAKYDNIPD